MAIRRFALLLAVLVASSQALATTSSFPELEAVGRTLYSKDRAAWLATDRLVETNGHLPGGILGWVTLPSDEGWRVFFLQEEHPPALIGPGGV